MSSKPIPQVAVAKREKLGSRYAARLRNPGRLPAVVYGHHQDPLHVSADAKELINVLHSHAHVIEVKVDDKTEPCLVKDVQWDHLGSKIVHVDLERVDLNETVTLEVDLKLVGEAIGLKEGGAILEHPLSSIEIQCLVTQIPDDIKVDVSNLAVGDTLLVRDLKLPTGVKTTLDEETVVASVSKVKEVVIETTPAEGAAAAAQPEVIGRKAEDGAPAAEGDKKAPAGDKKAEKK